MSYLCNEDAALATLMLMIRYAFRKERNADDPIEIEDDDDWVDPSRKFYWNPYSGELSLTFPTSNTKSKGGILADAMGMSELAMKCGRRHADESRNGQDVHDGIIDTSQSPRRFARPGRHASRGRRAAGQATQVQASHAVESVASCPYRRASGQHSARDSGRMPRVARVTMARRARQDVGKGHRHQLHVVRQRSDGYRSLVGARRHKARRRHYH